ncbi:MAG TPA: hypothetical protein PKW90_17595, partial [Myxococcota bacterium]|nr:hypothetical protein [Myxococcota bacterium]
MLLILLACTAPENKDSDSGAEAVEVLPEDCSLLPAPGDGVVLSPGDDLAAALADVAPHTTLILEPGSYELSNSLLLDKEGLTLRSRSGDPSSVILDGFYASPSLITIIASDVTLIGVTLTRSYGPALIVRGGDGKNTDGTRLYGLHIADAGEEALHIEPGSTSWADRGTLGCSELSRSAEGRENSSVSCLGGIDAIGAREWRIYGNNIHGFWCDDWPWAVRFRDGSGGTIIERNSITDSSRLVAFGDPEGPLSSPRNPADLVCPENVEVEHDGGFLRNNFLGLPSAELATDMRTGIGVYNSCQISILHNSYWSIPSPPTVLETFGQQSSGRLINGFWPSDPRPTVGAFSLSHNIVPESSDFVGEEDLHLS